MQGLDALLEQDWQPYLRKPSAYRIVYVQSHVRTRQWFKDGEAYGAQEAPVQQDHHTQSIDRSAPEAASAWTKALAQIRRYKLEETFGPILRLRPQRLDRKGRLVLRGSREALDGIVQAGLVPRLKKLVTHYGIAAGVVFTEEGPGGLRVEPKPLSKPLPRKITGGLQFVGDTLSAATGLHLGEAGEQASIALIGAKAADEIGYLHSFLAQAFLPRSKPKDDDGQEVREYTRRSGPLALALTAGRILGPQGEIKLRLPYGAKPRLMLVDVCTKAIQAQSPLVDMERTVRGYLERLHLQWGAGKRGQYTLFRNQAIALAGCRMEFLWSGGGQAIHYEGTPVREFRAWVADGEQLGLWPGELRLDSEFYQSLVRHGLPLDKRAVRELMGSALALDWYTFCAQRLRRIEPREPVDVSWEALRDAMGQEYCRVANFKARSTAAIKKVMVVYPGLSGAVESIPGGLRLKHCQPPIAEQKSKLLGDG